jgi:hypothetical protein
MSSRYTTTKELVKCHNISSVILMKFFGPFVKQKGMTNHTKTPFGLQGSFPYIFLLYWALMVAKLHIVLTESFFPLQLVKVIVSSRNWVPIPDCEFI